MQEEIIHIGKDISLIVKGTYWEAEEGTGIPESFDIEKIESVYKDISPLMEYCNSKPKGKIFEYIEELVLEKLK